MDDIDRMRFIPDVLYLASKICVLMLPINLESAGSRISGFPALNGISIRGCTMSERKEGRVRLREKGDPGGAQNIEHRPKSAFKLSI